MSTTGVLPMKIKVNSRWKELMAEDQVHIIRYINHLASGGKKIDYHNT